MLLSLPELMATYSLNITGVLHVGAHLAEEAETYQSLGITDVVWVEANPAVIAHLEEKVAHYGHRLVEALVYSKDDVILDFNVTNYDGMSSSILQFGTHPEFSPDTVFVEKLSLHTKTLDTIVGDVGFRGNFLNMDLQGAELHALRGATRVLQHIDYIMTEVNKAEVYKDCAKITAIDRFLSGFRRVETYWVPGQGWGDALYIREATSS